MTIVCALLIGGCRDDQPLTSVKTAAQRVGGTTGARITAGDYTAIDLGDLDSANSQALPIDLNDSDQVVGSSASNKPFLWSNGKLTDLLSGSTPGDFGVAQAINNAGLIAGAGAGAFTGDNVYALAWEGGVMRKSPIPAERLGGGANSYRMTEDGAILVQMAFDNPETDTRSFLWHGSDWTQISGLSGDFGVQAWAINAAHQVAGISYMGTQPDGRQHWHAFLWQSGATQDLGAVGAGICRDGVTRSCWDAYAYAINAQGDVAGRATDSTENYATDSLAPRLYPVLWRGGRAQKLADFEGTARAINDRGQVLVVRFTGDIATGPSYLWENGVLQDLGSLGGFTVATAMNQLGMIAGTSATGGAQSPVHAFVWQNGVLVDLGPGQMIGDGPQAANAINERGDVIGGIVVNRRLRGMLWRRSTPPPPPPPPPPPRGPAASFTVACSGLSCSFRDNSTDSSGRIVSRSWDFGDGRSGTGTQWTHTYYHGGTYTARLTVTDDSSRTGSASQSVTAGTPGQPPVARPGGPYSADSVVFFDGRASSDPNGLALTYAWDFGDGHNGTGATWAHTYYVAGTYTVTLVVTDSQGVASAPATTTATITKP